MERLTDRFDDGKVGVLNILDKEELIEVTDDDMDEITYASVQNALEKFYEYEDAEEQGLLLRLPCKVGDTVYKIIVTGYTGLFNPKYEVISADFEISMLEQFGKTVFLTPEAAEEALNGGTSKIIGSHTINTGNPLTASLLNTMGEAGREA